MALLNALHIAMPEVLSLVLMSDHLQLSIGVTKIVATVLLLTGLTTLSALYPSIRAARLKPVTAMHHLG